MCDSLPPSFDNYCELEYPSNEKYKNNIHPNIQTCINNGDNVIEILDSAYVINKYVWYGNRYGRFFK